MPRLTIDGRAVEVAPGTLLIEAALQVGREVPHFCYHPSLSPVGSCRMCQITIREGERPPRLAIACRTVAMDGMNVETESDLAHEARAGALEFYLSNHPLDCPICDKAGECDLQNFSYRHGYGEGRMVEPRRKGIKRAEFGGHIVFDSERCVLCTRCVRFMQEYAKAPQLTVTGRGVTSTISIFPGQPLDSDYTGNLADICPVGALTLREFRFASRVWDLKPHNAICPLCSRGCNIRLDVKMNRLYRVMPRANPDVNGYFICNRGRFDYLKLASPENRVTTPRVRGEGAPFTLAIAEARRLLNEAGENVLAVLSPRLTNEEISLLREVLGKGKLTALEVERGGGDDILRTDDPTPNMAGLARLGIEVITPDQLGSRLAELASPVLVLLDGEIKLGPNVRGGLRALIVQDVVLSEELLSADIVLPGGTPAEKWGTFINSENRLQKTRAGLRPPDGVRTEFDTWVQIGKEMGLTQLPENPAQAFAALRAELSCEPGLTFDAFPPRGLALASEAVAAEAVHEEA
ncbi:MAG: 2Fe-2S iron-sulfur cluster-binding protein [Planctomycetota bacterium]